MGFLDALHDWTQKSHAGVEWVPSQTRTSNNVVEHTAIPILSYALTNAVLKREPIPPFRGLAGSPQEAEAAVKDVVSLWIERQNRSQGATAGKLILEHPRYTVQRYQNGGKHNCWKAELTDYVCRLDSWSVSECIGRGATVQKARNDAAQKLLEGEVYCMFLLPDK
ncbi:hypothetical protein FRC09_014285 [Ceratobasidium sp. 395]|nr:hypothetical protein FRC09_014285 [Ceratobasidium sp. 395]